MNDPHPTLEVGQTFAGKYVVRGLPGRGGMGAVYRVEQVGLDRDVALKVMLADDGDARARQRFEREMRVTAGLKHPNTIRVLDFGEVEGVLFFTMELIEGESLERRLARVGRIAPGEATAIAIQIALALGEAHAAGMVHRDLKPDNLMLTSVFGQADFVRVLDFGVARSLHDDDAALKTKTGAILGTPLYMAPEQAVGGPVDQRADLYALG